MTRRERRLSQRELAEVVGVPPSTIDRIESGRSSAPSLRMIESILAATGYQLVVANNAGFPLLLDEERERLSDRGGRHRPAHVELERLGMRTFGWWGWVHGFGWPTVPAGREWVHRGRQHPQTRRHAPGTLTYKWDGAT